MKPKKYLKGKRGFAGMSPEKQRKIASLGGKRAHELGHAHTWTKEEARVAGQKGGRMRAKAFKKR